MHVGDYVLSATVFVGKIPHVGKISQTHMDFSPVVYLNHPCSVFDTIG